MERKNRGYGKLVFQEPGDPPRGIRGQITEKGDFFELENEHGRLLINRQYVIRVALEREDER